MGLHLCTALTSVPQLLSGWDALCRPLHPPESGQEWDGSSLKPSCWDCPGGPLTKNLCFQYRSIPGQGTKIPQARQYGKKKENNLSYSDPAGKNSLRGTAGYTPDWNISSQTRSPPSSALLHPAEDGFQSPPFSSGLLSGRHWQMTDLSFETRLPSGLLSQLSSCWNHGQYLPRRAQFSSVIQSCLTLCNPINRSMPGLPVHNHLPDLAQTHVQWVGDAIQPSHLLLSPSPPAFNLSQHQGLFKWVSSSPPNQHSLEKQTRSACPAPPLAPEKEAACSLNRELGTFLKSWRDHWKTSYTWAGLQRPGRGQWAPRRPRGRWRVRSPPWGRSPGQGPKHPCCGSKSTQKNQLIESDNINFPWLCSAQFSCPSVPSTLSLPV